MASGGGDENKSSWWGWGDKIIKTAKEKTLSTLELVKTDFTEFTTIMSNDTTNLINTATAQFVDKSNTASYLLDSFDNKVKLETTQLKISSSTVQERYENELKAIQLNEATYLNADESEEFVAWAGNFSSEENKGLISELLIENSSMRLIYSKLVPAVVSNEGFWCRYFWKSNLFEEEQKKRIKLLERVDQVEESVDWEEDEKTIDEGQVEIEEDVSKGVEEKSEAMVASINTENSDDWDKLDPSDNNESDSEKRKLQASKVEVEIVKKEETTKNDDGNDGNEAKSKADEWDDWAE